MRRRDLLLIYLHQEGNALLGAKEQKALIDKLAERYFSQGGSVTSALKELALALNLFFLNRNRKFTGQGKQAIGWLALAVWRSNTLYLALSGPMHAVVMGDENHHYHEPSLSGRGLGLGRSARVYFASTAVQAGDVLLLTPRLPAAWADETLRIDERRLIAPLLRRLMAYRGEAEAIIAQVRSTGENKRVVLGQEKTPPPSISPKPSAAPQQPAFPSSPPTAPSKPPSPEQPRPKPAPPSAAPPVSPSAASPDASPPPQKATSPLHPPRPEKSSPPPPPPTAKKPVRKARVRPLFRRVGEGLRAGMAALWRGSEKIIRGLAAAAGRGLSTSAEEVFALPRSFMALTAIAVPLIVVTIAVVVFTRRGRLQQFHAYLTRAQTEFHQAEAIQEPITRRNALAEALSDIQAAEAYYRNDASAELYGRIQKALDRLDGVQRLDFVPVSDRLPPNTSVRRLLFQGADLYALTSNGQRVFHFRFDEQHYRRDDDFHCHTPAFASIGMRPLVDIALLSLQPYPNAYSVVGIDDAGHVLLCGLDKEETAFTLPPTTPSNWKQPRAIDYQDGLLYLLDPPNKTVEIVDMNGEGEFGASPYNAFTTGAPPGTENAIALTVMNGGFYLLHEDGEVTRCTSHAEGGLACKMLPYNDTRPGRGQEPVIPDTRFSQIAVAPPPDPSLYLLDTHGQAVYRFSYQLRFVTQYRPRQPLEGDLSAFAIDPATQTLFVAAGRTIYQATLR